MADLRQDRLQQVDVSRVNHWDGLRNIKAAKKPCGQEDRRAQSDWYFQKSGPLKRALRSVCTKLFLSIGFLNIGFLSIGFVVGSHLEQRACSGTNTTFEFLAGLGRNFFTTVS